jgi:anti-sigma factor RsiW
MTPDWKENDWVLHAYTDGELEPPEKLAMERELANDPEARSAIEAWRRQNEALKRTFASVAEEQLPSGIRAALNKPRYMEIRRWHMFAAAAAVLMLLVGAFAIFRNLELGASDARAFADSALSAHVVYSAEVRHPVEVSASEKEHLNVWLSKRLGFNLNAPDLSAQGFHLIGGRLLHADRKPAAQFMYEDAKKRRLTVYVADNSTSRETSFRIEENSGYTACYWLDERAAYAVAAELRPEELLPLAASIYDALEKVEG